MGMVSRTTRRASLVVARNPLIRPSDRVLSALLSLVVLGVLASVPLAAAVGSVVHAQRAESAQAERQTRHQVWATLRADAPAVADYNGVTAKDTSVPAWWQAADGRVHTGTVVVHAGLHAGDIVPIWVDRSGAVVAAPRTASSTVGDGVVVALAVLTCAGLLLGGLYGLVRAAVLRGARRAWARQWREVEPRWSGRKGREPA